VAGSSIIRKDAQRALVADGVNAHEENRMKERKPDCLFREYIRMTLIMHLPYAIIRICRILVKLKQVKKFGEAITSIDSFGILAKSVAKNDGF